MKELHQPDIGLLQKLVRTPSISGHEAEIQKDILTYFRILGFSPEDAFMQSDKNVIVRLCGKQNDKAMMFIPHVDTVKPGKGWTRNPYGGKIETVENEERIYGRGSCDTKAGVFAAMEVATTLYERKLQGEELPYDVFFVFPVGEEVDNNGTRSFGKWFQENYGTQYKELSAIFLEPTDLNVKIGHRGNLIFQTEAKSDMSLTGIERMMEFLKKSYRQSQQWAQEQSGHPFGVTLINATNINSAKESTIKYQPKGKVVRIISSGKNTHASLTAAAKIEELSVNRLIAFINDAGTNIKPIAIRTESTVTNMTPSKIEIDIEITVGKEDTLLDQLSALSEKHNVSLNADIQPGDYIPYSDNVTASIDIRTIPLHHDGARNTYTDLAHTLAINFTEQPDTPPGSTSPDASIVKAYMKAAENIIKPIMPGIFTAASDMGVLQSLGGIFNNLQAVIFGAGSLEMAHKADEYVPLDQVYKLIDILLRWYEKWA